MKKKIGIISLIVVIIAVLSWIAFKFSSPSEWDVYEVANNSLKQLENAKSYTYESTTTSQMISPQDETLEDAIQEEVSVKVGSNGILKMDYWDNQIIEGEKRELGKATFYFDKETVHSDEESQFYHWKALDMLKEGQIDKSVESLSSFVDGLNDELAMKELEVDKEEKEGQYIITVTHTEPITGKVDLKETLYVDKNSKEPVKLESLNRGVGFEVKKIYQWKNINDTKDVTIPKEAEVITSN